jgi:hypothetical protein
VNTKDFLLFSCCNFFEKKKPDTIKKNGTACLEKHVTIALAIGVALLVPK